MARNLSSLDYIQNLNNQLPDNCEAKLHASGRIYYVNHLNQVTSWIPPRENWYPQNGLPYGWEEALDKNDKPYFINHIERYTTRADPREELDYVEPPRPRDVTLSRDPQRGFGFVAGSEKPVVVRFVTEGGPSMDKLLPGDQIIKINGEDVKKSPRDYVIDLVRSSEHTITLTVCQPYVENAGRRSAFLTPAKKARLRNNPTRVRFADAVIVNGTSVISPSCQESYVPLMPNVLKVFLENGQTKSFKYDNKTTVKDVLNSLQEKLSIRSIQHFALVLYNMRSPIPGKLAILREDETIAEIAAKPGSRHFRCLFRVTFVPVDAYALLKEDPASFEYYFTQCCNDVVQERFAGDLKYESMFRLAALQIHQHVTSRGTQTKFSLKSFEKEFGLNRFVPRTILENMKMKDVRRTLTHYLRQNQNLTLPGQKHLPTIQARLHYIKILSDLLTFGGRIFLATIAEGDNNKTEHMIVVGPRTGISRITNVKTYALEPIADFEHIEKMSVIRDGENIQWVSVELKGETTTTLCVGLLNDDVPDFLSLLEGYYRVLVDSNKVLLDKSQLQKPEGENSAPVYDGKHRVIPSHWSYPDNIVSQPVEMDTEQVVGKYVNGHETQDQAENVSRDGRDVQDTGSNGQKLSETNSDRLMRGHSSSFGLHSPDQLPCEMLQAVCNSECESSLCLDLDIIDLTLIPPIEVVDEEIRRGLCSSGTSAPPPGFSDDEVEDSAHRRQCKNHHYHHHHHHHQQKLIQPVSLAPDEASVKLLSSPSSDVYNVTAEIHSPSPPFCMDNHNDRQRTKGTRFAKVVEGEDDDISGSGDSGHRSENLSCSLDIPPSRRSKARAKRCQQMVRSASAEHCPSILDEDIDTLIAKLIVPPPPSMDDDISCHIQTSPQLMTQSWSGWSGDSSYSDTSQGGRDSGNLSLEEDISSLVIPPPPISSSSSSSESFNCTDKSLQPKQGAMSSLSSTSQLPPPPPPPPPIRTRYTRSPSYQRANSIDLLYERDFEETMLRRSDSQESVDSQIMLPVTDNSGGSIGQYRINIQSPTSVSEKLKNLLQLMPTADEEKQSIMGKSECSTSDGHSFIFRSTSESASLRNIFRKDANSLEVALRTEHKHNSQQPCDSKALNVIGMHKCTKHEPIFCTCDKKSLCCLQKSNEGCDQSKCRNNGQSGSQACTSSSEEAKSTEKQRGTCQTTSPWTVSSSKCNGDSSHNKNNAAQSTNELPSRCLGKSSSLDVGQPSEETNCAQVCSSSETFTALKSKLQAYRDFLLNRKTKSNTNNGGDLRRSSSFTVGTKVTDSMWKAVFNNGSNNNSSKRKVSQEATKGDNTPAPAVVEKNNSSGVNKQTLMMQGISTLPRAILRRRVNKNQHRCLGGARTGPMKALQNIFSTSSAGVESGDKPKVSEIKVEDISEAETEKAAPTDFYEVTSKKFKDNPYSTVRMWRPVALGNQSTDDPMRVTRYATFKRLWDSFKIQKTDEGENQGGDWTDFSIEDDDDYPKVKNEMLSRIYNNENGFTIATEDIEVLVVDIKMDMENLQNIQLIADRKHFVCVQSKLYQQIQQFVHHAKFFLINAALTKEKLVLSLMTCMHSLTRIFLYGRDTMIALNSVHKAQNLGSELIRLANAFKSTIHAANTAAGKPNTDPHVQYLMRQALSLASLLRNLLALVKSLEFQ